MYNQHHQQIPPPLSSYNEPVINHQADAGMKPLLSNNSIQQHHRQQQQQQNLPPRGSFHHSYSSQNNNGLHYGNNSHTSTTSSRYNADCAQQQSTLEPDDVVSKNNALHEWNRMYSTINNINQHHDDEYDTFDDIRYRQQQQHYHQQYQSTQRPVTHDPNLHHHGNNNNSSIISTMMTPDSSSSMASLLLLSSSPDTTTTTTKSFLVVRVVAAETRRDLTNNEYTAYIIRIVQQEQQSNNNNININNSQNNNNNNNNNNPNIMKPAVVVAEKQSKHCFDIERRYSDFYKLYNTLHQQYGIWISNDNEHQQHENNHSSSSSSSNNNNIISFPPKHWAGRCGNWTPSRIWTPESYDQLIQHRLIQLDIWLVHCVASIYNNNNNSNSNNNNHNYQQQQQPSTFPNNDDNNQNDSTSRGPYQLVHDFLFSTHVPPSQLVPIPLSSLSSSSSSSTISAVFDNNYNNNNPKMICHTPRTNWNNPISFTLSSAIRQATRTVQYMTRYGSHYLDDNSHNNNSNDSTTLSRTITNHLKHSSPSPISLGKNDTSIPLDLLQAAKGLVFLTVLKAGMVVSGRVGTGLIIAKLSGSSSSSLNRNPLHHSAGPTIGSSTWSSPCAVGTVGVGWGAQVGGDVTHYLIVLTTDKAVQDFCGCCSSSIQLGAECSISVGPVGRSATGSVTTGDWTIHPAYAYAVTQGLFVGLSIESAIFTIRHDVNTKFYEEPFVGSTLSSSIAAKKHRKQQQPISSLSLLQRQGCPGAQPLYDALDTALATSLPKYGFRPSLLFTTTTENNDNNDDEKEDSINEKESNHKHNHIHPHFASTTWQRY